MIGGMMDKEIKKRLNPALERFEQSVNKLCGKIDALISEIERLRRDIHAKR